MCPDVVVGQLGGDESQLINVPRLWFDVGLIADCPGTDKRLASLGQVQRLQRLQGCSVDLKELPPLPDTLFAPQPIVTLGSSTFLATAHSVIASRPEGLWRQLLPIWVEASSSRPSSDRIWREFEYGDLSLYTLESHVAGRVQAASQRMQEIHSARAPLFAHSANYMGSKSALADQIVEVVDTFEGPETVVLDLMCGSGAMAGAFARSHRTLASDAQIFSRLLAKVQGGGMSREGARTVAERVMSGARRRYDSVSPKLKNLIAEEEEFLSSELTSSVHRNLRSWISRRLASWEDTRLGSLEYVGPAHAQGELLSHLYGGLYFGERQAFELDCLRASIDDLTDGLNRDWALGALVCAASACAFTYGGHFAQPKVTAGTLDRPGDLLHDLVQQRALSVAHEFCARLEALGVESERVPNFVECIPGPWEAALDSVRNAYGKERVCVYIDPPYTRDEYSRYYHVLECIVRYAPQAVSGKGRIPARGTTGRFASAFSVRRADLVEAQIARVIDACLSQGWSCVWSYSNSGTASIHKAIKSLRQEVRQMEVFRMEHAYRVHGRRLSTSTGRRDIKPVQEFAIFLKPP